MKRTTLIELAEHTGLSITTISRALSGQAAKYRISQKTVDLIRSEAERLNYQPNINAQSLRTNRTQTIGLVVPTISNPFFANISSVIVQKAKENGYTVILADAMESEEQEAECVHSLIARQVDGIIISTSATNPILLEQINDTNIPVVLIDRFFPETSLPYVITDNYRGAWDATKHLIDNGHKQIACIGGIPHSGIVQERIRGYRDAMESAHLGDQIYIAGDSFSVQNGYVETQLLLNSAPRPTAIFAMNISIVLGCIQAIRELGLRIPEDISVVSFDDNRFLDFMNPRITRIIQPQNEIGSIALRILIQSIITKKRSNAQMMLLPSLKVCDSVHNIGGK